MWNHLEETLGPFFSKTRTHPQNKDDTTRHTTRDPKPHTPQKRHPTRTIRNIKVRKTNNPERHAEKKTLTQLRNRPEFQGPCHNFHAGKRR